MSDTLSAATKEQKRAIRDYAVAHDIPVAWTDNATGEGVNWIGVDVCQLPSELTNGIQFHEIKG